MDFQAFVPPMLSMLPSDVLAALPAFDRSVGYESTEMSREVNPLGSVGNTEDGTKIYKKRLKLEKERNGADTIGTRGVRAEEQIREDTTAMATVWEDSKPTVATIAILLEAATVQVNITLNFSILLAYYVFWSGALDSSVVVLSYYITSLASHMIILLISNLF